MTAVGLGIDTGGTYTDAVLVDLGSGKVLNKAKALTTREDLVIGIANALAGLSQSLLAHAQLVSLSTTLATNSVVEGKGCRVGLICIGLSFEEQGMVDEYAEVAGGHGMEGEELRPLDEPAVERALLRMQGRIDALAVTSFMSIRNPEHEDRVAELARKTLGVPVVRGHELSSAIGFKERTITAVMNARLIPVITELLGAVRKVLTREHIRAPLMIVKGDGTLMSEELAAERPVETVLSGPAASLIGAKALTGRTDAVVVDIGGTTSDIGVLRDGYPRLEAEGAIIGGRRTRVMAAAVSTFGLGGDSRFIVNGGELSLTTVRVLPLCVAAERWPRIRQTLRKLPAPLRAAQPFPADRVVQETEFFIAGRPVGSEVLDEADRQLLTYVAKEPHTLSEAGLALGIHPYMFSDARLVELGLIQRIGVTPTDLLCAEGSFRQFDRRASELAVDYLADLAGVGPAELIARGKRMVTEKLARDIMASLLLEEERPKTADLLGEDLIRRAVTGEAAPDYRVRIELTKPIIGIGAPVGAWLPAVAATFGTELVIPPNAEVGNAVGAVTGSVIETAVAEIEPIKGEAGLDPPCHLFSPFAQQDFDTATAAVAFARTEGTRYIEFRTRRAGAAEALVNCDVDRRIVSTKSGRVFVNAVLHFTGTGKPALLYQKD